LQQLEQHGLLADREAEFMFLMEAAGIQTNTHSFMDAVIKVFEV
jgi:hypothetical protein